MKLKNNNCFYSNNITFSILILLNLYKTNACYRSTSNTDANDNYQTENIFNQTKEIIESGRTCNKSLVNSMNSFFYCYHNGRCKVTLKEINSTHLERISFCICQKVCFHF